MKKKQFINEIMGVPRVLKPWVNSFYQIVMDAVKEEIKDGWDYTGQMPYTNPDTDERDVTEARKTDEILLPGDEVMESLMKINGYSDMKEFLNSEMFKGLPLWRPEIEINVRAVPNEVYKLEKGNTMSAAIGAELTQGLSKIGKIPVFPNISFIFNLLIPFDEENKKVETDLKSTIAHELLHGYQKLKQLESGKPSHFGKETTLNVMTQIPQMKDIELEDWNYFLHLVYLHLSFEINARVTELYYSLKSSGVDTKEKFLKEIKNTSTWKQMKMLKDFNAEEFISKFKLPGIDLDLESSNPFEMLHNALMGGIEMKSLEKRGLDTSSEENMLKSIIKLWDTMLQVGSEKIKQDTGVDFNMLPVPEKVKKDPYLFFKFFEDRFQRKAKKWERKLYRIASLLIQNENKPLQ